MAQLGVLLLPEEPIQAPTDTFFFNVGCLGFRGLSV